MKSQGLENILKEHGMRVTDSRLAVLRYFLQEDRALTFKDLENRFRDHDRVTLYRTLNSFTERGILHKIPDDSGFSTYGVCHETCEPGEHHHEHIHFKCDNCGDIMCIERKLPSVNIPGYIIHQKNLIINGICKECNANR